MTNMMMISTIMVKTKNDEAAARKNWDPIISSLIEHVFSSWSCTMDLRTPCLPVEYFSPSQLVEEKKKTFANGAPAPPSTKIEVAPQDQTHEYLML